MLVRVVEGSEAQLGGSVPGTVPSRKELRFFTMAVRSRGGILSAPPHGVLLKAHH